ncbi:hypothetical protein [Photorhabdus temperata]|uniref:hypothetical protein n=1 Tax=Photorhabdus temperata TaxID=574560 RepID=UPI00038A4E22|nr:hypothetical protein [Photorhabdus temperata]EQC01126.1 hypothetical protein B738_06089 [Photorhabdus temperata subsp. temperata M1021]
MNYNWTEKLSPMIGVPMLDIPAGDEVPPELQPRECYITKLNKLNEQVNDNHYQYKYQYYLSRIKSPTEQKISKIERLIEIRKEKK